MWGRVAVWLLVMVLTGCVGVGVGGVLGVCEC